MGGKPISLGEARVACVANASGWRTEPGGHAVRPPTADTAVGNVVELRVAPAASDCPRATASVKLVATAAWPTFDPSSFTLALDEGRLEARGHGLHGVLVTWPVDTGRASDACRDLKAEGGVETCAWGVPKTLSADPTRAAPLRWLPAGAQIGPDTALYDADGRITAPEGFAIAPGRVEVLDLLPPDASVDVSSGVGRAPLTHADAIAGVDCGAARCSVDSGQLVMQAPPAAVATVDVRFRLAPHVFYARKNPPDTQPVLRVSILRCPMSVVSGPALRGVDSARAVVRVEGGCMHDVAALRFLVGGRQADVTQTETAKDAAYAVVNLGDVDAPNVSITAVRGEGEGTVVAVARTETRPAPVIRTVLEVPGFPPIDFIPNNRPAVVLFPQVPGAELTLLPIEDVYEAKRRRRRRRPCRATSTRSAWWRSSSATASRRCRRPLDKVNLAALSDTLHRSVKEANIPAPFGLSAFTAIPLAEIRVHRRGREDRSTSTPGVPLHAPFHARDGCRVVIHRERLSPEYGTQKLSLEIEVDKLDGTSRPDGARRPDADPPRRDRAAHRLDQGRRRRRTTASSFASRTSPTRPTTSARSTSSTGAPAVQWSMVFGTGRVRLYATTAIPTGLYRFGTSTDERRPVAQPRGALAPHVARLRGARGPARPRGGHHGVRAHRRPVELRRVAHPGGRRRRPRASASPSRTPARRRRPRSTCTPGASNASRAAPPRAPAATCRRPRANAPSSSARASRSGTSARRSDAPCALDTRPTGYRLRASVRERLSIPGLQATGFGLQSERDSRGEAFFDSRIARPMRSD